MMANLRLELKNFKLRNINLNNFVIEVSLNDQKKYFRGTSTSISLKFVLFESITYFQIQKGRYIAYKIISRSTKMFVSRKD